MTAKPYRYKYSTFDKKFYFKPKMPYVQVEQDFTKHFQVL